MRLVAVVAAIVLLVGGVFAVLEVRTRTRRAGLDEFARLNQQYDCCVVVNAHCPKEAYDRVRELAQGDDDVAYLARTQYINVCSAFRPNPPVQAAAPRPKPPVMPVAEPPPPARLVERDGGATYEIGGQIASAGFVVVQEDGGVRAVAYAEDARCERTSVVLFDAEGRRDVALTTDTELGDLSIGDGGVRVRTAVLDPSHCEPSDAGDTRFVLEPGDGGQVPIAAVVAEIPEVPQADAEEERPPAEDDSDYDGDYFELNRTTPSAVIDLAAKRKILLVDSAGWDAVAVTAPDGGLYAIGYLTVDEQSACGLPRFALLEADGGVAERLTAQGTLGTLRIDEKFQAFVGGEQVLTFNRVHCMPDEDDPTPTKGFALVDPHGKLRPMRTITLR